MNNVSIINFWWTKNYGAKLTAFALSSLISDLSYSAKLIDNKINFQNELKIKNKYFPLFEKKYFKTINLKKPEILNKECNTFIVGSDQIFRISHLINYSEQFLLDFVKPESKKIAFSASFGVDKETFLKETSKEIIEHMKTSLSSFDFISVREKSGVEICKDVFGICAEWIIDPVFILDKLKYDDLIKESTKDYSNKIVSYVLDTDKNYKKAYKHLSKKYNKKVVEISNSNTSVENWLSAIKNCELLITDSFHGLCFAIIFNKPFICVSNKNRGKTRFESICEMLNIKNQCIDNINEIYEKECVFDIDYSQVNTRIEEEKQKGLNFLDKVLNTPVQVTQAKKDVRLKYLEQRVAELEERDSFKFQLKLKCLIIFHYLPKFLQNIIYNCWLKSKGFINAHRK